MKTVSIFIFLKFVLLLLVNKNKIRDSYGDVFLEKDKMSKEQVVLVFRNSKCFILLTK